MKLVDDWRKAWRWISVNCMVVAGVIQGTWVGLPDDMRAAVPPYTVAGITISVLILGIAGRLLKQGKRK